MRAVRRPNPCIRCNGGFRFAELLAFARRIGAPRLATGHYARIVEHGGRRLLARARDPRKDQSYMLARLDPRSLDRVWFPLGDQTKEETLAEAEAAGLLAAAGGRRARRRVSSPATTTARFSAGVGSVAKAGEIVDEAGLQVGTHEGFWRFTPGQRRGLGVSAAEPLYALSTNPRSNTVTVGPRSALARTRVSARGRLFA